MMGEPSAEDGKGDAAASETGEPSRLPPIAFAAVFALAGALALLPAEFGHYRRLLEIGQEETLLRVAVLSSVLAKSLLALLLVVGSVVLAAARARPGRLRALAAFATVAVLGWIVTDLEGQQRTGISLASFLPYVTDPETFRWVGEGLRVGPMLGAIAGRLALHLVPAALLTWVLERWSARAPRRRALVLVAGAIALTIAASLATPLLQRAAAAPAALHHLSEQMPWTTGRPAGSTRVGAWQRAAQDALERTLPTPRAVDLLAPRPAQPPPPLPTSLPVDARPDILLVVVESLRHDALDPVTMPKVWAAAERGLRLESHYATSNASHYGLFALLYGRSPLPYFQTLDAHVPPTLPTWLRAWGWTTHHLTCSDTRWRRMDEFMGPRDFEVERSKAPTLDACDRRVAARAAELLAPGERPPRLVLAFLMSTHFGYHHPEGATPFRPAAPPPDALALRPDQDTTALRNRYRNSAHHVDGLVGRLLDAVDLDRTLVVVTGDHGESLFDDGTLAHATRLSDIQTRVPFALFGAGLERRAPRDGPTDHTDVLPTLLARLGVDADDLADLSGQDLLSGRDDGFATLVHAKARGGGLDRLVLVSPEGRHALRLDAERGAILYLGRVDRDGRPIDGIGSDDARVRTIGRLERYLASLARR